MQPLNSRYLYTVHADLREGRDLGQTPVGQRIIFDVTGGRMKGRINGTVLPSGADWLLIGADGCCRLDVRAAAELDDGSILYTAYQGRLWFPPDLHPLPATHEELADLDRSRYYFRVAPFFETASETYHWLNRTVAVGVGWLTKTGVAYDVHEVL